jgi:hypothetical protein
MCINIFTIHSDQGSLERYYYYYNYSVNFISSLGPQLIPLADYTLCRYYMFLHSQCLCVANKKLYHPFFISFHVTIIYCLMWAYMSQDNSPVCRIRGVKEKF